MCLQMACFLYVKMWIYKYGGSEYTQRDVVFAHWNLLLEKSSVILRMAPSACKLLITSDMAGHLRCLLKSDFLIATPPRKRDGYTALSDTSISGPLVLQQATSRNVKFEEGKKNTKNGLSHWVVMTLPLDFILKIMGRLSCPYNVPEFFARTFS